MQYGGGDAKLNEKGGGGRDVGDHFHRGECGHEGDNDSGQLVTITERRHVSMAIAHLGVGDLIRSWA